MTRATTLVALLTTLAVVTPAVAQELTDALRELQAMRSVTSAGLNHGEYQKRVLDAKAAIDRYLATSTPAETDRREAVRAAIGYYVAAGNAWNNSIVLAGYFRGPRPATLPAYITGCEAAELRWDGSPRRQRDLNLTTTPAIVAFESGLYKELMQDLWACASRKAVEAERGPAPARPPVTATEAERQLRGVLERQGATEAKCEKRQYGSGWVTVCD